MPGSEGTCHCFYGCLQNVWPWLYDDKEDRRLFTALQSQLKFMTKFMEDGHVAIRHLEDELVFAACSDPSAHVEKQLVLPLLQQRIRAAAEDFAKAEAENQDANRVRGPS